MSYAPTMRFERMGYGGPLCARTTVVRERRTATVKAVLNDNSRVSIRRVPFLSSPWAATESRSPARRDPGSARPRAPPRAGPSGDSRPEMRYAMTSEPSEPSSTAPIPSRKDRTWAHAEPSPVGLSKKGVTRGVDRRTLCHRHDRQQAGQKMETVMREPHAGAEWNQRIGIADRDVLHAHRRPA